MPRLTSLILTLAALSATAAVSVAQYGSADGQGYPQRNNVPMQAQPAPIERGTVTQYGYNDNVAKLAVGQAISTRNTTASVLAAPGVYLRVGKASSVRAVALGGENTELSVQRGIANISVHQPVKHAQILVDLPGGQISLIKDGLYTFNARTSTVRVMKGEAYAYPTANAQHKPIKVKENHAVIFNGPHIASFEFDPVQGGADVIPYMPANGSGYYSNNGIYAGYPYYGYGYPYYDDYPFGFGLGFYGGGFYGGGGGFRGGGGGFHGGGGHGGGGHR